jgi:hypothetical protein
MLPVSLQTRQRYSQKKSKIAYGAEQLHASGAILHRPMTSAMTLYSRFVKSIPTLPDNPSQSRPSVLEVALAHSG